MTHPLHEAAKVSTALDEVMCGMGRAGHLFSCEADEIFPDILCIAKGLDGGYQRIGAMLCSSEIYRTIEDGTVFFSMVIHIWAIPLRLLLGWRLFQRHLIAGWPQGCGKWVTSWMRLCSLNLARTRTPAIYVAEACFGESNWSRAAKPRYHLILRCAWRL